MDENVSYDLPRSITTPKLHEFVAWKSGKTLQEIDAQPSVKIRTKYSEVQEYIMMQLVQLATSRWPSKTDIAIDSCLLETLRLHQQHAERQQQLMENLLLFRSNNDKSSRCKARHLWWRKLKPEDLDAVLQPSQ